MAIKHSRFIDLQGCVNFRDIGGHQNRLGQAVVWRRIFRSDSLHLMTADDTRHVYQTLGTVTLIDLRNSSEVQRDEYRSSIPPSVNYRHVPFLEQHGIDPFDVGDDPAARLAGIYLWILANSGHLIAEALTTLAEETSLPAVFHCTAGKDRTGVLAAMLLGILNVDEDKIMADYTLTNQTMDRLYPRLRSIPGNEKRPRASFEAQPKAMEAMLSALGNDYGGAQEYALAHGVSKANILQLRASLLA